MGNNDNRTSDVHFFILPRDTFGGIDPDDKTDSEKENSCSGSWSVLQLKTAMED